MPIISSRRFAATMSLVFLLLNSRAERLPGDFLDEGGHYLGKDGLVDHRLYVIRTTDMQPFDGVPYLGIDKDAAKRVKRFILAHTGDSAQFMKNPWIYDHVISIDSMDDIRKEMIQWVSQDNGGRDTAARNNREYGGLVSNQHKVIRKAIGKVVHPKDTAEIGLLSFGIELEEFHSHPSGMEHGDGHAQPPSYGDWQGVQNRVGYLFAMRTKIVYIYDHRGVLARLPMGHFAKYK
jgi:hypothetical protein